MEQPILTLTTIMIITFLSWAAEIFMLLGVVVAPNFIVVAILGAYFPFGPTPICGIA